jgi:general secretion pathway protein L
MKPFAMIEDTFFCWIDSVGGMVASLLDRFSTPRTVQLIEDEDGQFEIQKNGEAVDSNVKCNWIRIVDGEVRNIAPALQAAFLSGRRVEMILRCDRFLFQLLELPTRATEFMQGIVRSQIDRITPWSADKAAFGWSTPVEAEAERLIVTIAAIRLDLITPYVKAIAGIGVHSIAVFAALPEAGSDKIPIKIWEERGRGPNDIGRIRHLLVTILAAVSMTAVVALGANAVLGMSLAAQQIELDRQISAARAATGAAPSISSGSISTAQRALEDRKYDAPSTVLVLETLSKILPDNTHVTELRIERNKLRLTGITHDAPSLIGFIEQSGRFTHATFFAPTTRSPSEPGESFHIEATIQPLGPSL